MLEHKHCDTKIVNLITETAAKWLMGGYVYSLDKLNRGMIHNQGRTEQDSVRFHRTTRNGAQLKTYEMFISGIFHLIFSDAVDHGNWNHKKEKLQRKGDYYIKQWEVFKRPYRKWARILFEKSWENTNDLLTYEKTFKIINNQENAN